MYKMTLIKRKYAERNRINIKKRMTIRNKDKKRRRRIREQRGAREECSEKSRRKEEKNASAFPFRRDDGEKEREIEMEKEKKIGISFSPHIFPLFPGVAARFRICVVLVVVVVVTLSFFPRDSEFVWFSPM